MSGYKQDYSEDHSPMHDLGVDDALRDSELVASCPPSPPRGPQPPFPRYRKMYDLGYNSVPMFPHVCTRECQK